MSPNLTLKTQVWRFVVTGGFSAIVDFGLYVLLYKAVGLQVDLAKAISFIVGTITAYLINRRWTFRAPPSKRRFLAVVLLYALTFALHQGELWSPMRTRRLRAAAAVSLRTIGTPEAIDALRAISARGPRGARSAAKAELERVE